MFMSGNIKVGVGVFQTSLAMSSLLTYLTPRTSNVNAVDMAKKKSKYHHGDLLAKIESIAREKIRQNGAENLSLRSCARDAGVDPAAFYRHFKSKEDLLAHVANAAFADLSSAMQLAQATYLDTDPKEALTQIGLAYINYAVTEPHLFQMMFDLAGRFQVSGLPVDSSGGQRAYDILVTGIERLHPTTPTEVHVLMLWSIVHGFSKLANAGLGPDQPDFDRMSRALCKNAVKTIV